jgi:hypothetical protein
MQICLNSLTQGKRSDVGCKPEQPTGEIARAAEG